MLPPGVSVLGGVTMLYLAVRAPAALVVEDYARIEELTSQRFARDARATELELRAVLSLAADTQGGTTIRVELGGASSLAPPPALRLRLRHAGSAVKDREVVLASDANAAAGIYAGASDVADGRYAVELTPPDESWRLGGSLTRTSGTLRLEAQARD
jgi:hypothetical protein